MSKARIEFNLSDPDDKEDYKIYMMAPKLYSALIDINNYCRNELKHGSPSKETTRHLEAIKETIWAEVDLYE